MTTCIAEKAPVKMQVARLGRMLMVVLMLVSMLTILPVGALADISPGGEVSASPDISGEPSSEEPTEEPVEEPAPSDDKIHYISLGNNFLSDAILIESNDRYMLVDTSNPAWETAPSEEYAAPDGAQGVPDDADNVHAVVSYLRQLGVTSLDYVVLTHNHSDHIGGVSTLCREGLINAGTTVYYRTRARTVEALTHTDWENALYLSKALDALDTAGARVICLANEGITTLQMQVGDFSVDFMNLDNDGDGKPDFSRTIENNNSIVLLVTKGTTRTLLTADIEQKAELQMLDHLGKVEVLKVPHHGTATSSSYEFLQTLQPETAIVTGREYRQAGAYEYLTGIGTEIYVTCPYAYPALVQLVYDDGYAITGSAPMKQAFYDYWGDIPVDPQPLEEGWNAWLDHWFYVKDGQLLRDDWRYIDVAWYYFNADGIMQTVAQEPGTG